MDFYTLSDKSVAQELGGRLKACRLQRNITQKDLATATTLSLNSIKSLESGRGKLSTLIAVMRALEVLDHLDSFLPEVTISPMQLAKMQGHVRQRASGEHVKSEEAGKDESEW